VIHPPPEPARELTPAIPGLPSDLGRWAREAVGIVALTASLYLVVNAFVAQPFEVELRSMEPTLAAGDHILVDKMTPRWQPYERGDLVVFDAPVPHDRDGVPYVKRVVAVAGETVELVNGRVYVTAADGSVARLDEAYLADGVVTLPQGGSAAFRWTVPAGSVFVLGDNRAESIDSRTFGPVAIDRIEGRAWLRYLPPIPPSRRPASGSSIWRPSVLWCSRNAPRTGPPHPRHHERSSHGFNGEMAR
jgi:signal peptidase I